KDYETGKLAIGRHASSKKVWRAHTHANASTRVQYSPPPVGGVYNADPSSEFGGVQVSGYQSDDAHVNMDIDTSNVKRIDDYQELPQEEQTEQAKAEMTTTYQELRSKNRSQRPIYQSQYAPQQPSQQGQPGSYQWQPQQSSPPARSPPQRKSQDDDEFSLGRKSRKNKYGDDWE
ncbi:uncharacterized protein, partial [Amphiura filiformis]|uniref:uncharacterized protein n=1 Tax=Amphiura filiformis TaxID=82378 RepID=UPI003B2184FF